MARLTTESRCPSGSPPYSPEFDPIDMPLPKLKAQLGGDDQGETRSHPDCRAIRTGVARGGEELAIIGEHRVRLVGPSRDQSPHAVARHPPCGFVMQLS